MKAHKEWFHGAQEVDFVSSDGQRVTRYCRIGEIPARIRVAGRTFKRAFELAGATVQGAPLRRRDGHFEAHTVARWHPDAPDHSPEGWARFNSRREVEDFAAKHNGRVDETGRGMRIHYGDVD